MSEPLTAALARAASRFVGESKVGPRKGSAAAVARAMTDHGVPISNNTLSRKLAGEYPLDSDEIGALAAVLGVDPDEIWAEAIRLMRASSPPMTSAETAEHALSQVSPAAQAAIRAVRDEHARESEGGNGATGSLAN